MKDDMFFGNMSFPQFAFMAEEEGQYDLIDTPDARFNAALAEMQALGSLHWALSENVGAEVDAILIKHGMHPDEIDEDDAGYINRAIN